MEKSAKIYVAGHLGLVGSAIWKNLHSKGFRNLIGKSFEELDLLDQNAVQRFFELEKPEYVILAAAKVGGIVANNTYRGQFIYENLQIQNNVIHQAYLNRVKKLLFLGSTCIYPRQAPQPMPEDCLLSGELEYTNEPYAIAKIAGLKMCESYNLQYGTHFIAVMPTNLYGPNDNFDLEKSHVLPAIIRKIHLGNCLLRDDWQAICSDFDQRPVEGVSGSDGQEKIREKLEKFGIQQAGSTVEVEIWGSGKPMREFLWSEEMADACVYLLENYTFASEGRPTGAEVRNTHINIGTGKEISIAELALLVKNTIGFEGRLRFNTSKPDGTLRKLTDVSKLHASGWHHQIDIEQGVKKLYDWYKAN